VRSRTYWQIIHENLFTFLNMTLIGIGVLLIGLGLVTEALVSSGLAVINAVVGIIQEVIAKHRLDQIALIVRAQATVVRDGDEHGVDPKALVLGDVLVLRSGDQVMLDGRVVGDGRIEVDESLLTGESEPVSKRPGDPVFSGSHAVSGSARYQAERVGDETMVSQLTAGARAYRQVITPLQRQINLIVRLLLAIAGTFLVMLLVTSVVWGIPLADTALAAAVIVGIVPAGLFLMVTVTYAMAAIRLAQDLEPYRLFFYEDPFAPEDNGYFNLLRQHSTIPVAMGELYVNQAEYVNLIKDRLIDFIRVHISDVGGLSPARKLAAYCEFFNVRTAWHGPGDASPVAHAANLALDLSSSNFGIQEATIWGDRSREVFPGTPEIREGALWSNDLPGLGIDLHEELAARYPFPEHPINGAWPDIRLRDGEIVRP